MQNRPNISDTHLWEYDIPTFHWNKSYKIVIERVLEMGDLEEWREIVKFYNRKQIRQTITWSAQLKKHQKQFCFLFLKSDFLNVTQKS